MKYFTPAFSQFFKDLASNNNREWFEANKSKFQSDVKKPFEVFVADLIESMKKKKYDLNDDLSVSDCVFRIYRDVRFSKDKTPYKVNVSALITKGGKKHMDTPGLYIELNANGGNIYTGVYQPDKEQLISIRELIASDGKSLDKIIQNKKFVDTYAEVQGEKAKKLSPELKEAAEKFPLIYNKQYYLRHSFPAKLLSSDDLLKYCLDTFAVAGPFNQYLFKAL